PHKPSITGWQVTLSAFLPLLLELFEKMKFVLLSRLNQDALENYFSQGVDEVVKLHLVFPTLDNGTLVDQQLTFLVVNPDYGKVLEFSPPPAYSGMIPKGTANVFADSDGFLGIVAVLCVKPFLCARLVSDVQMQLSCCLPLISKGAALFFPWELCSREGNITVDT
ncbi:hypothetical protein AVEN_44147-2-1, partial [Araneus ventricosus]